MTWLDWMALGVALVGAVVISALGISEMRRERRKREAAARLQGPDFLAMRAQVEAFGAVLGEQLLPAVQRATEAFDAFARAVVESRRAEAEAWRLRGPFGESPDPQEDTLPSS